MQLLTSEISLAYSATTSAVKKKMFFNIDARRSCFVWSMKKSKDK